MLTYRISVIIRLLLTFLWFWIFLTKGLYGHCLNLLLFHRTVAVIGSHIRDLIDVLHAIDDLAKCSVSAV
jgi:hypothetical protein